MRAGPGGVPGNSAGDHGTVRMLATGGRVGTGLGSMTVETLRGAQVAEAGLAERGQPAQGVQACVTGSASTEG